MSPLPILPTLADEDALKVKIGAKVRESERKKRQARNQKEAKNKANPTIPPDHSGGHDQDEGPDGDGYSGDYDGDGGGGDYD